MSLNIHFCIFKVLGLVYFIIKVLQRYAFFVTFSFSPPQINREKITFATSTSESFPAIPMPKQYFAFRNFTLYQSHAAMKAGTDSVLLGAWSALEKAHRLLDIGSGTGILALFAAQRNPNARITAIEIDPEAAKDAALNFKNSPYSERLELLNEDFRVFFQGIESQSIFLQKYDYILSNPPYFSQALLSPDTQRTQARHDSTLTYRELIQGVARLLTPEGKFSLIIPEEYAPTVRAEAFDERLYTCRQTVVSAKSSGEGTRRVLLEFARTLEICRTDTFSIHETNGAYSTRFRELTRPLYREGYFES